MVAASEPLIGIPDIARRYSVIDSDTHYNEWPDLWTSRAPAKYRERVPHVREVDGQDKWFIEGDQEFGRVGACVIDPEGGKLVGKISYDRFEEMNRAAWDVKARLAFMDSLGITAQITYPQVAGFSEMKLIKSVKDQELRTIIATIYNDAMAEVQRESGNRIFPQALLPVWEDQATIMKEARRAVDDLHLTGFVMGDRPEMLGVPDYGQEFWTPLWELCNDRRIPLNFHLGGSSAIEAGQVPWASFGPQRKLAITSVMFFIANSGFVSNFIYSGLLDKYPNLKLVSVESGIGWVPFVLEALEYQLDETVPDEVKLSRRPTQLFHDHFYATFWFEKLAFSRLIDVVGVENVLFETDFPHPTCLYPENREHVNRALTSLDEYGRRRILQDNAIELYHLPIETRK